MKQFLFWCGVLLASLCLLYWPVGVYEQSQADWSEEVIRCKQQAETLTKMRPRIINQIHKRQFAEAELEEAKIFVTKNPALVWEGDHPYPDTWIIPGDR